MLRFAIVPEGEVFDPVAHAREDLTTFNLSISQDEGDYARADLRILNERGPMPGKRLLISEDGELLIDGYITSSIGQVGETIELEVIAKPKDAETRLATLTESLKVAPYYDELTVAPGSRGDISEVIEGYPRALAWDRRTHAVAAVDIYAGSSHLDLEPIHGSLGRTFDLPPSEVRVSARANWRQLRRDIHDVGDDLEGLTTMTPDGLIENWPEPGDMLGTGFYITGASITEAVDWRGETIAEEVVSEQNLFDGYHIDPAFLADGVVQQKAFLVELAPILRVEHVYELRRVETLEFAVPLRLQDGFVPGAPDEISINLQEITERISTPEWESGNAYLLNERVVYGDKIYRSLFDHTSSFKFEPDLWAFVSDTVYVVSRRHSSFMKSTRGAELAAHMLERAKARAERRSRCVRLSFDTEMPDLAALTADCTATVSSPSIVGGSATGKVVRYALHWTSGRRYAEITIACAPGTGEADTIEFGELASETPNSWGRVEARIKFPGDEQRAYFAEHGHLDVEDEKTGKSKMMETQIEFDPVPASSGDLVGWASYPVQGTCGVPFGIAIS